MNTFLHLAALYMIIGLTFAHPGSGILSYFGLGQHSTTHDFKSICSNTTTAPIYLAQILTLIRNLQANSSANAVLQLHSANYVSYLQNTANQALLLTNCPSFVANLKVAKSADQTAEHIREQIAAHIEQQFHQVSRNATGNNGHNELDISEKKDKH